MSVWDDLDGFKVKGWPENWPENIKTYFAPDDLLHEALVCLVKSARIFVKAAMYGYDDDELDQLFRDAWNNEKLPVTLALDKTQAGGRHEKELLAKWPQTMIGNQIAIGQSRKHAISHLKMIVVDGLYQVQGSTNLSDSGEMKQNNELTIIRNPVVAAVGAAKIMLCHSEMLQQMAAVPIR